MQQQIDDFLHFVAVERGYSDHTIAAYRNDLTQFLRYLVGQGVASWHDVGRAQILNYILYLKEREYAPSTVARKIAAVKSYFHFLVSDGVLADDPTVSVDSPPVDRHLPHPLSPEEIARLLAEPSKADTPKASRDQALRRWCQMNLSNPEEADDLYGETKVTAWEKPSPWSTSSHKAMRSRRRWHAALAVRPAPCVDTCVVSKKAERQSWDVVQATPVAGRGWPVRADRKSTT